MENTQDQLNQNPIPDEPAQPISPPAPTLETDTPPSPEPLTPETSTSSALKPSTPITPEINTPIAPEPSSTIASESNTSTLSEPSATTPTNTNPVQNSNPAPKKKRTGLIASVIIALLILLGGGGAFATFAIIKNSPESILSDSINHLMSADQIAINGDLNLSTKNLGIGIDSVNLNFDAKRAQSNQHTEASLQINFANGISTNLVNFGEIMLQNGIFYLHIDGLNELYQNTLRSSISSYINSIIQSNYTSNAYEECYDSYFYTSDSSANDSLILDSFACTNIASPEIDSAVAEQSARLLSQIDQIVAKIDNQWFEFSIENILNSDLLTNQLAIPASTKQGIISTYNCTIDVANQISNYADDFSDLYSHYPFINLTQTQDNYHNVSINAEHLANYLNNIYSLNFYQDLAKCANTTLPTNSYQISADDITSSLEYMPDVALRFDGFFDHHLTDIKVAQSNNYYDLSLNINFTYPSNLQISAPADSRPIMELIQEIYIMLQTTFQD